MNSTLEVYPRLDHGYKLLDQGQSQDALQIFRQALELYPESFSLQIAYNRALRKIIPRWHFAMINDNERNAAFDCALQRAIHHNTHVLDIGSGSGLLGMMAARAGAKSVISCEIIEEIARLADEIVHQNGYPQIKIIPKKSTELIVGIDMEQKANLLVSEIVDSGLLGEGVIPSVLHARNHLLTPGAKIIPKAAKIFAMLIESHDIASINQVNYVAGFDVTHFNKVATKEYFSARLAQYPYRRLSDPVELYSFDFESDPLQPETKEVGVIATENGRCNLISFWFLLNLYEGITLSNCPENLKTHWPQAVQLWNTPLNIQRGQKLLVTTRHDCFSIFFESLKTSE